MDGVSSASTGGDDWQTRLVHYQRSAAGASDTSLGINLCFDDTILKAYGQVDTHGLDRKAFGKALGGKRGADGLFGGCTPYTQRLGDADLRRFDWVEAQQLRGVALTLWIVFASRRVPYRASIVGRSACTTRPMRPAPPL